MIRKPCKFNSKLNQALNNNDLPPKKQRKRDKVRNQIKKIQNYFSKRTRVEQIIFLALVTGTGVGVYFIFDEKSRTMAFSFCLKVGSTVAKSVSTGFSRCKAKFFSEENLNPNLEIETSKAGASNETKPKWVMWGIVFLILSKKLYDSLSDVNEQRFIEIPDIPSPPSWWEEIYIVRVITGSVMIFGGVGCIGVAQTLPEDQSNQLSALGSGLMFAGWQLVTQGHAPA